jgi:DNA-binding NarL/FixJ family response regulator
MHRPRVLVVDDNAPVLDFVVGLVDNEFEIVGTAQDGASAVEAAIHLNPDVIVVDLSMPTLNGLQVAERLRANSYFTAIVLLTIVEDAELVRSARSAGILGYVTKRRVRSDLMLALRSVLAGRPFVSPIFGADDLS